PINALARILAGLQADDGRIRVDGFYDDVLEPGEAELAAWRRLDFDEDRFLATAGVSER
ncbi:MAG: M20 family dipeptidase, partial [Gammaproteobacteria bacterium]|nr:M20 family dipeptidase [Gammaproteobacteria bacterium]